MASDAEKYEGLVELNRPIGLYLKPVAMLNITVQMPQMKSTGKSISNWDIMEKLKRMLKPHVFNSIKVVKTTLDFVRIEAEIENRKNLNDIIKLLDRKTIKIIGFFEALEIRATECKLPFPTKHDWDAWFRDAKNMNEMRPGERPDTVYIANVPSKWFSDRRSATAGPSNSLLPSERVIRRVFSVFGEIRSLDVPICDPYRKGMSGETRWASQSLSAGAFSGAEVAARGERISFDAYIQFSEYIGFVRCMDALRNMKLVYIAKAEGDENAEAAGVVSAVIKVDFDRTKHLSDKRIRKRRLERERLQRLEDQKKEAERRAEEERKRLQNEDLMRQEILQLQEEANRFERRRQREERRRLRAVERKRLEDQDRLDRKIALEERKLLLAQRRLEAMRLMSEVFRRVQLVRQREETERQMRELDELKEQEEEERIRMKKEEEERKKRLLERREAALRNKVLSSARVAGRGLLGKRQSLLLSAIAARGAKLRSMAILRGSSSGRARAAMAASRLLALRSAAMVGGSSASRPNLMTDGQDIWNRRIFVGGLAPEVTNAMLYEYFSNFGFVVDAIVKMDPSTQRSRGFGFVTFATHIVQEAVVAIGEHIIGGRKVDVRQAVASSKIQQHQTEERESNVPVAPIMRFDAHSVNKLVYVGGLPSDCSSDDLMDYFRPYGAVEDAEVRYDPMTLEHSGYGFVRFEDTIVQLNVVRATRHIIRDQKTDVRNVEQVQRNVEYTRLIVFNLAKEVDDFALDEYFSKFGDVRSAIVEYDSETRCTRCFATVEYSSPQDACTACSMQHVLANQQLELRPLVRVTDVPDIAPNSSIYMDYCVVNEEDEEAMEM